MIWHTKRWYIDKAAQLEEEIMLIKKQYVERVSLERKNLRALEDRYNVLEEAYMKMAGGPPKLEA